MKPQLDWRARDKVKARSPTPLNYERETRLKHARPPLSTVSLREGLGGVPVKSSADVSEAHKKARARFHKEKSVHS